MTDASDIMAQLAAVCGEPDISESGVPYWLPTSLPNVNMLLSGDRNKGFPGGRIITIAGPESSGKTALATEATVQTQKLGGFGGLQDYEHAFHHGHAKSLGVDYGRFFPKKPDTAEEGFENALKMILAIRAAELGLKLPDMEKKLDEALPIVRAATRKALAGGKTNLMPISMIMDSVASMTTAEQDISYGKQNMKTKNMSLAAFMSMELKRAARDYDSMNATLFLLNQLRNNPGIMFGDSSTEPGGKAIAFYASVQLRIRRVGKWYATYGDKNSEIIGDIVEVYSRKNKVYRPFKKTQYVFRTADPVGLDVIGTMIHLGKEGGVLGPVGGVTLQFDGKRHNVNDFDAACRADPALKEKFVNFVMDSINPIADGPVVHDDDDGGDDGGGAFAGLPTIPVVPASE